MKIKPILCKVIGHSWGRWITLDGPSRVRQCIRCLILDTDADPLAFFDDEV